MYGLTDGEGPCESACDQISAIIIGGRALPLVIGGYDNTGSSGVFGFENATYAEFIDGRSFTFQFPANGTLDPIDPSLGFLQDNGDGTITFTLPTTFSGRVTDYINALSSQTLTLGLHYADGSLDQLNFGIVPVTQTAPELAAL
ncbi:MAG: hypothetical protein R3C42_01160 [Parvularculaceae bacterium]